MFNHAPSGYRCPFCMLVAGIKDEGLHTVEQDVIWRDNSVLAFVASHWWENNPGHVLIIPAAHFENIYDLPDGIGTKIFQAARRVALALKRAYHCDGVSTRQHNEPSGDQEVWHYHLHVFPRYSGDRLYSNNRKKKAPEAERAIYATKLRELLNDRDLLKFET